MRILKVFDGDYPWDVRVEKIVDSLVEAGHEVRLVCRNRRAEARRERMPGGFEVVRLPALPDPLTMPLFFSPVWAFAVAREMRRQRPDLVIVRDLPLAPLVVTLARVARLPVVVDYSEPYPESLRSQRMFDRKSLLDRVIRNPAVAEWLEGYVVRHASSLWAPCEEAISRLAPKGLRPGQAIEIGNTPRLEHFAVAQTGPLDRSIPELSAPFPLVFSGLLAGDRGLDTAIDAMARLEARRPGHYTLVIIGHGPAREALERQIRDRNLQDRVRLTGFIAYERLPAIVSQARLGLLPFHRCSHIEHTLANKLFEYMALGLPVVVSDVRPMVRVIASTRAGVTFPAGDAGALAAAIESLADDEPRRLSMGKAGREATRDRYQWRLEEARLLRNLEALT